ncbi:MAG: hypothetical protein OQL10_12250 [Sedimenticola sp.]|nr:hypothetical protein [Sedimenticola sp.]
MRMIIGSMGWDHPEWCEQFYPDDLPSEWRLTYYANAFPQVLLPAADWMSGDSELFRSWYADVSDTFRFILDVTGIEAADSQVLIQLQCCVSALGERLAGVVSWSALPQRLCTQLRVLLGDEAFLATPACPSVDPEVQLAGDRATLCVLVSSEVGRDLHRLRLVFDALIEQFAAMPSVCLFISGVPPEVKVMQDAATLWQLIAGMQR